MKAHSTASTAHWRARRAAEGVSVELIARVGYVAKGVVYAIIAWFAIEAAFSAGGRTTGSRGALAQIVSETYGEVLLILIAIGLSAYAFWRFVQSVADAENEGTDLKGLVTRALYFASGVVHASLVIWASQLIAGDTSSGEQQSGADSFATQLMSTSYGQWLVAAVGVMVIAVGIAQFVRGYREKFTRRLNLSSLTPELRKWAVRSGKAGLMARGVVFWIIGVFFVVAAYRADPQEAKGLGGALRALEQAPYGPYLLGAVGIGLLGYAVHQFVTARLRVFPSTGRS